MTSAWQTRLQKELAEGIAHWILGSEWSGMNITPDDILDRPDQIEIVQKGHELAEKIRSTRNWKPNAGNRAGGRQIRGTKQDRQNDQTKQRKAR